MNNLKSANNCSKIPFILARLPDIENGVEKLQEESSVHSIWPVTHFTNMPESSDGRRVGGSEHKADTMHLQLGRVEGLLADIFLK